MGIVITIDDAGMKVESSAGSVAEVQGAARLLEALELPLDLLRSSANEYFDSLEAPAVRL